MAAARPVSIGRRAAGGDGPETPIPNGERNSTTGTAAGDVLPKTREGQLLDLQCPCPCAARQRVDAKSESGGMEDMTSREGRARDPELMTDRTRGENCGGDDRRRRLRFGSFYSPRSTVIFCRLQRCSPYEKWGAGWTMSQSPCVCGRVELGIRKSSGSNGSYLDSIIK